MSVADRTRLVCEARTAIGDKEGVRTYSRTRLVCGVPAAFGDEGEGLVTSPRVGDRQHANEASSHEFVGLRPTNTYLDDAPPGEADLSSSVIFEPGAPNAPAVQGDG